LNKTEILNIDCMEYMAGLEDNAFDLAIVDPPYGIGESGSSNNSRGSLRSMKRISAKNPTGKGIPSTQFTSKEWDKFPPTKNYFTELQRVSKNQIIWGANHFMQNIQQGSPCWIVWDKDNGNSDFADCELAYASFKTAVRIFKFTWNGMLQGDMGNKEKRIHPTQKPVRLYDWLLQNYAKPEMRILDTHLGSGSSAIAAHYFGCDFVGCEIDRDYFEAAEKRFEKETRQLGLGL
jgi:site-specific DNA-methyltransferase (adenine-specific)